jgi:hypothetical protein
MPLPLNTRPWRCIGGVEIKSCTHCLPWLEIHIRALADFYLLSGQESVVLGVQEVGGGRISSGDMVVHRIVPATSRDQVPVIWDITTNHLNITPKQPHFGMSLRSEFSRLGCDHVIWCTGICWLQKTLMIVAVDCSAKLLPFYRIDCIKSQKIVIPTLH